jgi:FkbM family methyltransferase
VRKVLNHLGYDIHRIEFAGPPIDVLSLAVRDRLRELETLFVLQVGANDGTSGDPVADIIRAYRLPSLLVEPLPEAFCRLQANYSDQQQVRLENCAVAEIDGITPLWRVVGDAVPAWATQWASFERGVVERNSRSLTCTYHIESVNVSAMTISSLLAKHGVEAVDLLQIDTEGYDDCILRMVLNARQLPKIVSYEDAHLSTDRRNNAMKLLTEHGYRTCRVGRDVVAMLASNADRGAALH